MLSLYSLGWLVCVSLHGLSTSARGHFAMDSSKRKAGRPKKNQGEHYYQSRLDDGFTNDQVEEMKNRISKHRGLFKPPRTPERFWDPDIIEDSAEDPRNKIFHASPLRKRREEKAFEVGELVNGDEFE